MSFRRPLVASAGMMMSRDCWRMYSGSLEIIFQSSEFASSETTASTVVFEIRGLPSASVLHVVDPFIEAICPERWKKKTE